MCTPTARRQSSFSRGGVIFLSLVICPHAGCFKQFSENTTNLVSQPAPVDDQNQLPAYIKQCEAVLGPIPQISCDPANPAPGTVVSKIPTFVDGQLLAFSSDVSAAEQTLLTQRQTSGSYTCDFPSIGGTFPCTVGSTLVQYQSSTNPNVQWVGLCRGVFNDNPGYDRFIGNGLIGANVKTGEMCFFFALNPQTDQPYVLPRLSSDADASALAPWLPPNQMPGSCISCHPNNDPWIFTPWLQPSYMREYLTSTSYPLKMPASVAIDDVFAANIITSTPVAIQQLLPTPLPDGRTSWSEEEIIDAHGDVALRQYRIVGSGYVNAEANGEQLPRTGMVKPATWFVNFRDRVRLKPMEQSCSAGCHAMGNEHWISMAHDSEGTKYSAFLTTQMTSLSLPGDDWMPNLPGWSDIDDPATYTIPAITECPLPKQLTGEVDVQCGLGAVDVSWTYVNDFGAVPGRDDVRFDVAALADTVAADGLGVSPASPLEGVSLNESAGVSIVRDLAASDGSSYVMHVPLSSTRPSQILLQPKRYCFEEPLRRPFAYAPPRVVQVPACP
jgi:hypothetical protein